MNDTPETLLAKERKFAELLKTEFLLLTGAALAACELNDTRGLYEVVKMLHSPKALPGFARHIEQIDARKAADAAKVEALKAGKPKPSTGPSPWSL